MGTPPSLPFPTGCFSTALLPAHASRCGEDDSDPGVEHPSWVPCPICQLCFSPAKVQHPRGVRAVGSEPPQAPQPPRGAGGTRGMLWVPGVVRSEPLRGVPAQGEGGGEVLGPPRWCPRG